MKCEYGLYYPLLFCPQNTVLLTLDGLVDKILNNFVQFLIVSEVGIEDARGVDQLGDGGQVGQVAGG